MFAPPAHPRRPLCTHPALLPARRLPVQITALRSAYAVVSDVLVEEAGALNDVVPDPPSLPR